jgi:DNA-directed RNA polymerase subunit beta'
LHAKIQVPSQSSVTDEKYLSANKKYVTTTPGRLLFEERLPAGFVTKFGHITEPLRKREFGVIVERLSDHFAKSEIANALDDIKDLCYRYATQSGLTVSVDDV